MRPSTPSDSFCLPLVLILAIALAGCQSQSNAPDFTLSVVQQSHDVRPISLSGLVNNGPVVIIFHRGLHCPLCAQNLSRFAERIGDFRSAGVQIIAISPETPAEVRDAIDSYGAFPFPLLYDRDDATARAFGLEEPDGTFLHGAFVIDGQRRIRLAKKSDEPYGGVSELLETAIRSKSPR